MQKKIIESRFQDDSSSGSSNYGSSSSSGSDNYSDSDNEIGENGRKNYLKSKLKKTNKTRKHEKAKKKYHFLHQPNVDIQLVKVVPMMIK